jgi:hypothetical protein
MIISCVAKDVLGCTRGRIEDQVGASFPNLLAMNDAGASEKLVLFPRRYGGSPNVFEVAV